MDSDWQPSPSAAVHSYRYLPGKVALQIRFQSNPDKVYDFPCTPRLYQEFRTAPSHGQYVEDVLRPYAKRMGWTDLAREHGQSPAGL